MKGKIITIMELISSTRETVRKTTRANEEKQKCGKYQGSNMSNIYWILHKIKPKKKKIAITGRNSYVISLCNMTSQTTKIILTKVLYE